MSMEQGKKITSLRAKSLMGKKGDGKSAITSMKYRMGNGVSEIKPKAGSEAKLKRLAPKAM